MWLIKSECFWKEGNPKRQPVRYYWIGITKMRNDPTVSDISQDISVSTSLFSTVRSPDSCSNLKIQNTERVFMQRFLLCSKIIDFDIHMNMEIISVDF